ncbi:MAG TPA: DUF4019 domain-containing protein [Sphingomonas sp.]|jgi:hypothetical protein
MRDAHERERRRGRFDGQGEAGAPPPGPRDDSYRETGATFRASNTAKVWADVSEEMRRQFGPTVGRRTLLSQERLPAPPRGYEVVKFRTRFAQGGEAIETVTLNLEDGVWRVVGVTVG